MGKLKNVQPGSSKRLKQPQKDESPYSLINHPIFCFKHLHPSHDLRGCSKNEKAALVEKLASLSQLSWINIQQLDRHKTGTEKIDQSSIRVGIPPHITKDISFLALRFDGMKPIIGYRTGFIFHIIYIDNKFKVYSHSG